MVSIFLEGADILFIPMVVLVAFILYILPWNIASSRGHRNSGAIAALNILLGWTGIGWVLALVWSLTANTEPS